MKTFQHFATAAMLLGLAAAVPNRACAQVTITNPDTHPIPVEDVDPGGRIPLQLQFDVSTPAGVTFGDSVGSGQSAVVPAGLRLVLEHIGYQGACFAGASPNIAFGVRVHAPNLPSPSKQDARIYVAKVSGGFKSAADPAGASGPMYGSSPMQLYLPGGSTLYGATVRDGSAGNCTGMISISGYLKTVPGN